MPDRDKFKGRKSSSGWTISWKKGVALTVLLSISLQLTVVVEGNHQNLCFGTPQEDPVASFSVKTLHYHGWSTQAKSLLFSKGWKGLGSRTDFERPTLKLEVTGIKIDDRFMQGWLHLKITTTGAPIDRFGISARGTRKEAGVDVSVGAVGEFTPGPVCSEKETIQNTDNAPFQFMPCGGVNAFEPAMTNGYMFISNQPDTAFGKNENKRMTVEVNFRFIQNPCNWYRELTFRVQGILEGAQGKGENRIVTAQGRKIVFKPDYIMGAPDAVPLEGTFTKVSCNNPLDPASYPWVASVQDSLLTNKDCITDFICTTKRAENSQDHVDNVYFNARCSNNFDMANLKVKNPEGEGRVIGSPKNPQVCPVPEGIKAWNDKAITEVAYLAEQLKPKAGKDLILGDVNCRDPCPYINPRLVTTTPAPDAPPPPGTVEAERKGIPIERTPMALSFYDGRIWHGMLMTVMTIFVMPVTNFITRYYKETFMHTRFMFHRFWYMMHHMGVAATFVLFTVGLYGTSQNAQYIGHSLTDAGQTHVAVGWFSFTLFLCMLVGGGFRPKSRWLRSITIILHFTCGTIIHYLNVTCLLTSVYIPGTPSSDENSDQSAIASGKGDHLKAELTFNSYSLLTVVFILGELGFHAGMTVLQCRVDKTLQLTRRRYYLPSPIPVLMEHDDFDIPGTPLRRILLIAFTAFCAAICVIMCLIMMTADPEHKGFGPMTCSHDSNGKFKFNNNPYQPYQDC